MRHSDIPYGYWKTRGYIKTVPTPYLVWLRRNLDRHSSFRWAIAVELNRRFSTK